MEPKDIAPVVVAAGRIVDTHSSIFAKVLQKNSEISKFWLPDGLGRGYNPKTQDES